MQGSQPLHVFPSGNSNMWMNMESWWNDTDRGKLKYWEKKTCHSANLSSTNPTWTDLGSHGGFRRDTPATDRPSHGTATLKTKIKLYTNIQFVPHSKHSVSDIKTSQLMCYREIIAVCSQIHTKHIT